MACRLPCAEHNLHRHSEDLGGDQSPPPQKAPTKKKKKEGFEIYSVASVVPQVLNTRHSHTCVFPSAVTDRDQEFRGDCTCRGSLSACSEEERILGGQVFV